MRTAAWTSAASQTYRSREPQAERGVNSRYPVIRHDTPSTRQRFGLARREWLPNIKYAKKYKTEQQIFPVEDRAERDKTERDALPGKLSCSPPPHRNAATDEESKMLPRNFVNHHALRVVLLPIPGRASRTPHSDDSQQDRQDNLHPHERVPMPPRNTEEESVIAVLGYYYSGRHCTERPPRHEGKDQARERTKGTRSFGEVAEASGGRDEKGEARFLSGIRFGG